MAFQNHWLITLISPYNVNHNIYDYPQQLRLSKIIVANFIQNERKAIKMDECIHYIREPTIYSEITIA